MRFQSYFNTAVLIIHAYDGTITLHHFLKQYFSQHKKHGSTDRKIITHLCYNFYRLGKALFELNVEEKLKLAFFICNDKSDNWHFLYNEEWLNNWSNSLKQRINFVYSKYGTFSLKNIFPFADDISNDLDFETFATSFFIQPDVFIRTRQDHFNDVLNKLQQHKTAYNFVDENCISLSPAVNISSIINVDEEAVVQDYTSQRINEFFKIIDTETNHQNKLDVWDCCAGSGGKSILAYDVLQNINLTVSDVRPSIIQNLKQRFAKAGIKKYKSFVEDAAIANNIIHSSKFDLIICDAPCTGSGTWSRTPEQLYFFQREKIGYYTRLQQQIVSNTFFALKDNGYFLYITCSIFKEENEMIVDYISQKFQPEIIKIEVLKGYDKKADTMFTALFKKCKNCS